MAEMELVRVDKTQLQSEIHKRNTFFRAIKSCQEICARYILPDSQLKAEDAMSELVGILDNKDLVKEMYE